MPDLISEALSQAAVGILVYFLFRDISDRIFLVYCDLTSLVV